MAILRGFALLLALHLAGEIVVRLFDLSVPGPVAGLSLLVVALLAWPPLERHVAAAADALLAHLSLLFVPAGVGVVVHLGRLDGVVTGVVATLLLSTVVGLAVTALVLQTLLRRSSVVPLERGQVGQGPAERGPGGERPAESERRG